MKTNQVIKLFKYINMLGAVCIAIGISIFTDMILGIGTLLLLAIISFLSYRYINEKRFGDFHSITNLIVIVVSVLISFVICSKINIILSIKTLPIGTVWKNIFKIGLIIFMMLYVMNFIYIYLMRAISVKKNKKYIKAMIINIVALGYMIFISFPNSLFLNNLEDIDLTVGILFKSLFPVFLFFLFVLFLVTLLFNEFWYLISVRLLCALNVLIYFQYMFGNVYLNELDGRVFTYSEHPVVTVINILIWFTVIIIVLLFLKNDKYISIYIYISSLLFLIQFTTGIYSLVSCPKEAYYNTKYYTDNSEEYVLGAEENVVIIVLDAVDNDYINEILEKEPDFFNEFNDFTLNNNTCSVYDYTAISMSQMFTGYCYGDSDNYADEFFMRIKDAGYKINYYGALGSAYFPDVRSYIDSLKKMSIDDKNDITIGYYDIAKDFICMSLYQGLPYALKGFININNLSFNHILIKDVSGGFNHQNEAFDSGMKYALSDEYNRCFYVHHTVGAHYPCDNYVEATKYCLNTCKKMIDQFKNLGIYDNCTIIITADHGLHDQVPPYEWPTAGTPMFMIKEANTHRESMSISSAPIYHKDFQSTILVNMGLFDYGEDYEKFGPSIYDFEDGELRERSWHDLGTEGYRVYTYVGDYDELKRCVNEDEYTIMSSEEMR